ncbi:PREDICTED: NKG2D ligand 3 isoform X2 [Capra hircus]|uniref:NKG2D ligand 3 isoform X2 n=1 Tax=Capra hircus TaxID=9925 RepID=UPI00084798E8|nr:PREDICTED: NKG2D ligand 3 isoform X2 [Capra hircus]
MAWIGGSKPHLCFLPLLLFYPFSAKPGDAHSLCYNFTVNSQPRPGQPWCVVQGQVDGKIFLSYDCGRAKIQFTSPLGEEVKTTKAWETQTETLRDVGDLLREQLPDVTSEKHRVTENGHWTVVHSGGRRMREKWEKDRAVSNFFKKVSMGDCRAWLRDFLVRWEEMLTTTASPTAAPLRVNSTATAIKHITWILHVLLTSFIITVFLG